MEGEKMLMAAGVTAAVVTAAFVFWGPTGLQLCKYNFEDLFSEIIEFSFHPQKGASRLRQRRGQIAGLHNFGRTCFLNTLLQALAACPQFIAWLQLHGASEKKSLIGSLLCTLEGNLLLSMFVCACVWKMCHPFTFCPSNFNVTQ